MNATYCFVLHCCLLTVKLSSNISDLSQVNECNTFVRLQKENKGGFFSSLSHQPFTDPFIIIRNDFKPMPQCLHKLKVINNHENFTFLYEYKEIGFDQIYKWLHIYIDTSVLFRTTFNACFENFFSPNDKMYLYIPWQRGSYMVFFNSLVFGHFLDLERRIMCKLDFLVKRHSIKIDSENILKEILIRYASIVKLVYLFVEKTEAEYIEAINPQKPNQNKVNENKAVIKVISVLTNAANIIFFESIINVFLVLFEFKQNKYKIIIQKKQSVFDDLETRSILRVYDEAIYKFEGLIDILQWNGINTLLNETPKDVFGNQMDNFIYVIKELNKTIGELMNLFLLTRDWNFR